MPTKGRIQVAPGGTIQSAEWGNPLWDQSIQCFASAADRDAQYPVPHEGSLAFLADSKAVTIYANGGWRFLSGGRTVLTGTEGFTLNGLNNRDMAAVDIDPGWPWVATLIGTGVSTPSGSGPASPSYRIIGPGVVILNQIPFNVAGGGAQTVAAHYTSPTGAPARIALNVEVPSGFATTTYGNVGGLSALVQPYGG